MFSLGNYQAQIDQALADAGQSTDDGSALFHCVGGASGVIQYLQTCPGACHDAGSGNDDDCQ